MPNTFWPEDTDTELYIPSYSNTSLADLIEKAKKHFGEDVSLEDLEIGSEYIHTNCITYDLFDSSDWTDFVVITKVKTHEN